MLVTYLILLPHLLALFMTSLTQTAGHKMAALTVGVFVTFKRRFSGNGTSSAKLLCRFRFLFCVVLLGCFIPLPSTGSVMLFQSGSPLNRKNHFLYPSCFAGSPNSKLCTAPVTGVGGMGPDHSLPPIHTTAPTRTCTLKIKINRFVFTLHE